MLTTWKQTRTTIECPLTSSATSRDSGDARKKKKKTKKSRPSEEEKEEDAILSHTTQDDGDDDDVVAVMGAQFVPPLSHHSSYLREKIHASLGKSSKKRRKINNEAAMEKEPILCITSPHRVVFMENKGEKSKNDDGTMIESKSRTYVSRPGASSRFTLHGNIGKYASFSSGKNDSDNDDGPSAAVAFAGMIPPGAKYDPASNLIYAIRNGGAEIAIWSAVSYSILPGPDDDVGAGRINGTTSERTDAHESSSADAIISSRLKLPRGKNAVTLMPISIPASSLEGKETIGADGAVGCCEDGSIWLAIRHLSDGKCSKFQILVVDGSSNEVVEPSSASRSGVKATKRRKTSTTNTNSGLRLLDSSAIGTIEKSAVHISIHSVLLSGDNAQVVYRSHQLRVDNKEVSSDAQGAIHIERCRTQNIMQLDKSASDIAVKLNPGADSLLIVHNERDRWLVTSINLSESDGALTNSIRTFSLPGDHAKSTTVFSFGMLGRSVVAMLMKSQLSKSKASVMVLRIIDFRRKAELSSICWLEGDDLGMEGADLRFKNIPRMKLLIGKRCNAMVTNASDGSIALMTSTDEDTGLLHIVHSKLEASSAVGIGAPTATDCTSLASALRFAVLSGPSHTPTVPSLNLLKTITKDAEHVVQSTSVDGAFDEVCTLLTTTAKELIQHAGKSAVANGVIVNGKSRKGLQYSAKNACSISWRKVYQDCCTLLLNTNGKGVNQSTNMVNGIVNSSTRILSEDVPKGFFEVAFKETANILLSFHQVGAPINGKSGSQEVVRDATSVLLEVLRTKRISSRRDYGIKLNSRDHIFLSILHACPTLLQAANGYKTVGKLHVMNAILDNVQDIPEGVLVSILRFLLRYVSVDDVIAYYPCASDASERGIKLLNQYTAKSLSDAQEESRKLIGTKLLSEAVLDFTSKIVTYSKCNQSFLTHAIRVSINSSGEVETLLLTLAKLLRVGRPQILEGDCATPLQKIGPFLGAIQWITALTDAHMCTILKISNEGGVVMDRIQHAVRSVIAQSEFANEVRELLNLFSVVDKESTNPDAKPTTSFSLPRETRILPYTVERLAF